MIFKNREKEIVRSLVQYDFCELKTLSLFYREIMLKGDDSIALFLLKDMSQTVVYYDKTVSRKELYQFCQFFVLISSLIEERLIYMIPGNDDPEFVSNRVVDFHADGNGYTSGDGNEKITSDLRWIKNGQDLFSHIIINEQQLPIIKSLNEVPIISEELIALVKNNFLTEETLQYKKTLFWTRVSAGIAFAGLIAAIIIPLLS